MSWNENTTRVRVRQAWAASANIEVKSLVKETSFDSLSLTTAYDVDGVHIYVDIPNALALIGDDNERDHAKVLRFLNIFMRVAHLVFQRTDAIKVDLQNTRLHFVVYKPYDSEISRVRTAVAIAALLRHTLLAGNALHVELPDARAVIGIESGRALAVRNGTHADREPLFLGNPANHAAKLTGQPRSAGIYVGPVARAALGKAYFALEPAAACLTSVQVDECAAAANLALTKDVVSKLWDEERKEHAISEFQFTRFTPPLAGFDLEQLSPRNSKRQELVVIYADIDGFTSYVANALQGGRATEAARVLHVVRKELRDILHEFGGRKIRYIGDCVQGVLVEGTSQATDAETTVLAAVMCAAAMRSAFAVIRSEVPAASTLGLQIGLELGPTTVTRVGVQGSRDRCVVGKATLEAERAQRDCSANETAIGPAAYAAAPQLVRDAFGAARKSTEIDYDRLATRLDRAEDARAARYGAAPAVPDPIRPRAFCNE